MAPTQPLNPVKTLQKFMCSKETSGKKNRCQEAQNKNGDPRYINYFPFHFWLERCTLILERCTLIYGMISVQYRQNPIRQNPIIQQALKMHFSLLLALFPLSFPFISVLHRYRPRILLTFCSSPDGNSVPEISRRVTSY